jgi:uncharacterized protein (DUF885 family)
MGADAMRDLKRKTPNAIIILLLVNLIAGCSSPTSQPTAAIFPTTAPPEVAAVPTELDTVQGDQETKPATETVAPEPGIDVIIASLEGLPLEVFFEESFKQLTLRSPQIITEAGVAELLGVRNNKLDDLSDEYLRETQKLEAGILDLLRTYDREVLSDEDKISYDVYEWYLDNLVRGHEFAYHDYPMNHFLNSYQFAIDNLFTETHPLITRQDAEDYITRLSLVDDQVAQLLEGLQLREEMGVIPPQYILEMAKYDLLEQLQLNSPDPASINSKSLRVYTRFSEELESIDELTPEEKDNFREAARAAIELAFTPAYIELIEYVDYLIPLATLDAGVWKLPDGEAYYEYLIRQETSTDLTPEEIHQIGAVEVDRIQGEIRAALVEMGYPAEASFDELMGRVINEGGFFEISSPQGREDYIETIEATIQEADQAVNEYFDLRPSGEVIVIPGPTGGYYVPGTADGSRPGSYHVSLQGLWRTKYTLQTIAYHETIPGHHFQIALAQTLDLPSFRNYLNFNAYAEGWALYAEHLAWEIGLYDENPYGNIGRLEFELLRAARLVADTGIHAMGWDRRQAQLYMDMTMGLPGQYTYEVDRYIVLPAQATGYKIGMIKMLELRQRAEDALGDQFDLCEFHNVILGHGSMPLEILDRVVQDYINAKLNSE